LETKVADLLHPAESKRHRGQEKYRGLHGGRVGVSSRVSSTLDYVSRRRRLSDEYISLSLSSSTLYSIHYAVHCEVDLTEQRRHLIARLILSNNAKHL
jgi:hypothetical protein